VHEREAEVQATLHATRVAAHLAVGRLHQPHALEQLAAAAFAVGAAQPVQRALQAHVLAAGQVGVERGLLQRGADRAAHRRALARDVQPGHARAAGGRRQQRRQHQHGRRLARAVGAEEAIDLAGRHPQIDAVDRAHAALEVADQAVDLDAVLGRRAVTRAR